MFSEDSDKTVFRQPSIDQDKTVLKSSRGGHTSSGFEQVSVSRVPEFASSIIESNTLDNGHYEYRETGGLNTLLNVSSALISVFDKVRRTRSHGDIAGLHQNLVNEIKIFEAKAKNQGVQSETVLLARYVICAALDEAILNTPWGSESVWNQRTLLSIFHNETSGGEKVFLILDRIREMPSTNLDFLEFMYVLLSLGFAGKYRVVHGGKDRLEQIRADLFHLIRSQRGEYERSLSPCWTGLGENGATLKQYLPVRVVISIALAVLIISYSGFSLWMQQSSSPLVEELYSVSNNKSSSVLYNATHK